MPLNANLLKTAREKVALGELGPYDSDRAADVVGADAQIASMERNRKEHPVNYWANPFVRGPLAEVFTRLSRRMNASAGTNVPNAMGREAFNMTGPLTALGGPVAGGLGATAGLLHAGVGGYMGGAKRKEKLRSGQEDTNKRYSERDEDKAEIKKDNKNTKKANMRLFGSYFGKQAAAPPMQRPSMGPTIARAPGREMGPTIARAPGREMGPPVADPMMENQRAVNAPDDRNAMGGFEIMAKPQLPPPAPKPRMMPPGPPGSGMAGAVMKNLNQVPAQAAVRGGSAIPKIGPAAAAGVGSATGGMSGAVGAGLKRLFR